MSEVGIYKKLSADISQNYRAESNVLGRVNNRSEIEREYMMLFSDKDYTDVEYNPDNGGLKARHVKRHNHSSKKEETFFGDEKLTSTALELECQDNLYRLGHRAILMPEKIKGENGDYLPSLDMVLNGKRMDIKSITSATEYGNALLTKNKQLNNMFNKTGLDSDSVCLYFHKPSMFSDKIMKDSIDSFKTRVTGVQRIKKVYVVTNGCKSIIEYNI